MIGDLYNVVCATPMNYGRWRAGLACGCTLTVLKEDAVKEKLACMNEHAGFPPAEPPPGGWPTAEPPEPPDESDSWKE